MFVECLVMNETIPVFCLVYNFPHLTLWENSIYARNSTRSCVPGRAAGHSELDRWTVRWCRC